MKRLLWGVVVALGLCFVGVGTANLPHQKPGVRRFLIAIPLSQLRALRLQPQDVVGQMGLLVADQKALSQLQLAGVTVEVREVGKVPIPDPFYDPQEIQDELKRLATQYPDRAELVDLNQRFRTALTAEGRSLQALRIRYPITDTAPRPIVVLDSLHHARELITPMITVDAAKQLIENANRDPDVTAWLKHYEIWIVPVVNPDGYQFVFNTEPFWRKNRRPHPGGSFGVDINRNYPYLWGACGKHSADAQSEVFKGLAAASEPEVQTMVAMGDALRPNLYLSYHSYGNEVIRPYICKDAAEEAFLQRVTERLATAAGYQFRKASSSGESFEHFYAMYGALSFLIEVGTLFHPEVEKIPTLVASARKTWRALLARGMEAALRGVVVDANGAPVQASLSLDEVAFKAGEIRQSHAQDGRFYWVLPQGTYTFRVQAPGFLAWSQKVLVPKDQPLSLRVILQRQSQGESIDTPPDGGMTPEEPRHSEEPVLDTSANRDSVIDVLPDTSVSIDLPTQADVAAPTEPAKDALDAPDTKALEQAGPSPQGNCGCVSGEHVTGHLVWLFFLLAGLLYQARRRTRTR